jgi:hypothetical protein
MHLFEIIYNISNKPLKKIGGQMGSNPGGLYQIEDQQYYVKFPQDPDIAKVEVLANKIYELLGVNVPKVELIEKDGEIGLTSKIVDLLDDDNIEDYMEELSDHSEIKDNFIIDAWLANWDVGGYNFYSKNILFDKDHKPLRIDQGGALTRRARGELKGKAFGNKVLELESLRDNRATKMARDAFSKVGKADLLIGLKKLENLDINKLKDLIDEYAPDKEKKSIYNTLINRRNYILSRFT